MTPPLRALLVDDSPTDAKLVVQELTRGGRPVEFRRVDTAEDMREALAAETWDVVLSDWSMPRFTAAAALASLRETRLDLPFIIVSGTVDEETAVAAMRAGAHDYVLKDRLARLVPAVERGIRECKERLARNQTEEALRAAEEALRVSEEQYRVLFENSPLAKWLYDVGTLRFLAVNDVAVRTYGYSREELLRMTIKDIRPPEDVPALMANLHRTLPNGYVGVFRHRKKDGTDFDAELHAHTFQYGASTQRLIVARDVTEHRRLEEQLRQAQKMEAVGRLAGGVAHDFNNILSVIISYSEMLQSDLPAADPMRADVEEIGRAGRRAADLTRQLLSFSRQQVLDPRVLSLNDLLTNVDKMLRRVLGADIDLATLPAHNLGRVRADSGSIEQVIMNLVVNARDAMPTGGHLTIETANVLLDDGYSRLHPGSRPGPHVMVAVSDTGTGMDAATLGRIFEPFFTTKAQGKGTGLGLSTVFGIVHQHGGTVWAYSEPGKGTTFKIFLPCVDADLDAAVSESHAPAARGDETILLVDDDEQVRAVTRAILVKHGYQVLEAPNAGEALLIAESHPGAIHLLLTDVVMPYVSGPALAKRLGAVRPDMKVLCMSGYTDDSIVRHGVIEGKVAFLQKPVTPQSLTRKVRAVLDGNGGKRRP